MLNRPLRVLHIYRTYFPETQGGVQEAIRQIALATRPLGVESSVFTLAQHPDPAKLHAEEGEIVRARSLFEIASCDFASPAGIQRCRAAAQHADLLQVHYPWPFADMMLPWIRRPGQPLVVTYHSDIVRQGWLNTLYAPLRNYLLNSADRIIATSPPYAQTSEVLAAYRDKTSCIPLALADCPPADSTLKAHWEARLGNDFFLFVGVPRYYKGLHFLIEALPHTRAQVVVVGDGTGRSELEARARQIGADNIRFLGRLPDADKQALFELCRGVVFPSHLRSEAFGVTLLEGARAGKPLISCEIGTGTSWVNLDQESGLVIPPADPAALASALNQLHHDPALCARLGRQARLRWQQMFQPAAVGEAYAGLYRELLEQAQAAS